MKKVLEILSAIGGAIASFFVNMPPLVWILIAVMTMDFITGVYTLRRISCIKINIELQS